MLEAVIGFGDMATADTEVMRSKGISDSQFSRQRSAQALGRGRRRVAERFCWPAATGPSGWACRMVVTRSRPRRRRAHLDPRSGAGRSLRRGSWRQRVGAGQVAEKTNWVWGPTTSRSSPSTTPRRWPTIPTSRSCTSGLPNSLGRSEGAPLFIVSQKALTGHAKGGAAVFQMMGWCQILRDGVIPPNRWTASTRSWRRRGTLRVVPRRIRMGDKYPLKAGLVTSLGFRPRVGLVALVHPQAFLATHSIPNSGGTTPPGPRSGPLPAQSASAIAGGRPTYQRPADRRFDHDHPEAAGGGRYCCSMRRR